MFSLVFVVIMHMRSDTGLKVTFVFSTMIIPTLRIDFAPLPELYKQTFFPPDEVNSCKSVAFINKWAVNKLKSSTVLFATHTDIRSDPIKAYDFIA